MGAKQLREAFNAVAGSTATCHAALLDYVRQNGTDWQILIFHGICADGTAFEVKSDLIPPNGNVEAAARKTAEIMLEQRKSI